MKKYQWTTLVFLLVLSARVAAADAPGDEVSRFVRAAMEKQPIPGLALLVSHRHRRDDALLEAEAVTVTSRAP